MDYRLYITLLLLHGCHDMLDQSVNRRTDMLLISWHKRHTFGKTWQIHPTHRQASPRQFSFGFWKEAIRTGIKSLTTNKACSCRYSRMVEARWKMVASSVQSVSGMRCVLSWLHRFWIRSNVHTEATSGKDRKMDSKNRMPWITRGEWSCNTS